jgi:hypothetical protein
VPSLAASRASAAENQDGHAPPRAPHLEQDTEPGWHGPCFRGRGGMFQMYSILYIIGAIVVIIVVLRVLGLV